jgi:hypothetical protein
LLAICSQDMTRRDYQPMMYPTCTLHHRKCDNHKMRSLCWKWQFAADLLEYPVLS